MDVRAHLLSSLRGSKYSNNRHLGFLLNLRWLNTVTKQRIKFRRGRLVVVDTIQSHSKEIHDEEQMGSSWRGVRGGGLFSPVLVPGNYIGRTASFQNEISIIG